jgi:hypothetical protein
VREYDAIFYNTEAMSHKIWLKMSKKIFKLYFKMQVIDAFFFVKCNDFMVKLLIGMLLTLYQKLFT